MADTGATLPGNGDTVERGGQNWIQSQRIEQLNLAAYSDIPNFGSSDWLRGNTFGFSIDSGATIDGIKLEISRRAELASTIRDTSVRLLDASGNPQGDDEALSVFWPTSQATQTYGGATEMWGYAWTPAIINHVGGLFGAQLYAANFDLENNRSAYVYWYKITIYYTLGGVTHEIATVITCAATTGGVLKPIRGIASASAGIASVSGAAKISKKIASAIDGVAAVSASIKRNQYLAVVSDGVAAVSAAAKVAKKLISSAAGVASVSAAIRATREIASAIAGVASVSAVIRPIRGLQTAIAGVATTAGAIMITRGLASVIAGIATVTASIKGTFSLAAVSNGVASVIATLTTEELDLQVGASYDDCARRLSGTPYFNRLYNTCWAGANGSTFYAFGSGMRFTVVTIPNGKTITAAKLIFRAAATASGGDCNTRISAEKEDNPGEFADSGSAFDTRWANRTTERQNWDAIPTWTEGEDYDSEDFKEVIQEIVNRAGWESGNSIVIFWEDFEERSANSSGNFRQGESYDGSVANAPRLHIEWTTGVGTVLLAAVIAGVATVSAVMKATRKIASVISGVATVAGVITGKWLMATAIAGTASVSAVVRPLRGLQAAIAGIATVSGAAKITKKLASVIDGIATVVGAISIGGEVILRVVIAGVASVSSAVKVSKKIASAIAGVASVSGFARITKTLLVASAGIATVTAAISRGKKLIVAISGSSAVSGAIKISKGLMVSIAGTSVVSGAIKMVFKLATAIAGSSVVSGSVSILEKVIKICETAMPSAVKKAFTLGKVKETHDLGDTQDKYTLGGKS